MAAWIKMSHGMELGLGPGDFVLDGDPAPTPQKGAKRPPQIFGPCLLWPNETEKLAFRDRDSDNFRRDETETRHEYVSRLTR